MRAFCFCRATSMVGGLLVALTLSAPEGQAQGPRKALQPPAAVAAAAAPTAAKEKVAIKKIEGIGSAARIKTPVYTVTVSDNNNNLAAREWARILVRFDTDADWTDELLFHYYVQVRNTKTNKDMLFTGDFTYLDLPKGKGHLATVFLRPATLERFGDVVGIAVEIEAKGEKVAQASVPDAPSGWWLISKAPKVSGVLLERSQTPFALVDYDAYVTEKPR